MALGDHHGDPFWLRLFLEATQTVEEGMPKIELLSCTSRTTATKDMADEVCIDEGGVQHVHEEGLVPLHALPPHCIRSRMLVRDVNTNLALVVVHDDQGLADVVPHPVLQRNHPAVLVDGGEHDDLRERE